jgi:hypothetical protein
LGLAEKREASVPIPTRVELLELGFAMQETRTFLRILIASPSDTVEERDIVEEAIHDINRQHGREEGFLLEPVRWEEDSYSALGVDGQDVINRQLSDYQVFVGIMNTRFGSPTQRADSGTEEEFERALERYWTRPEDIKILFYFRNATVKFYDLDADQALRVHDFRARMWKLGLAKDYATTLEFQKRIRAELLSNVRDLVRRPSRAGSTPPTPLDVKERLSYGDWHATTRKTTPQWTNHKTILLDRVRRCPLRLTGVFQSRSPYFRFGFKLTSIRGRIFGDGSIQSNDNNVLVHIGRNGRNVDSGVFVTSYRNGVRLDSSRPILDYDDCRPLHLELAIDADCNATLDVEGQQIYETYIDREIKSRLLLLAWGDGNEYDIMFREITLIVG